MFTPGISANMFCTNLTTMHSELTFIGQVPSHGVDNASGFREPCCKHLCSSLHLWRVAKPFVTGVSKGFSWAYDLDDLLLSKSHETCWCCFYEVPQLRSVIIDFYPIVIAIFSLPIPCWCSSNSWRYPSGSECISKQNRDTLMTIQWQAHLRPNTCTTCITKHNCWHWIIDQRGLGWLEDDIISKVRPFPEVLIYNMHKCLNIKILILNIYMVH